MELKRARKTHKQSQTASGLPVLQIKTDEIRTNQAQPRLDFDNNSIIRLADSIRRYGIIQPLVVRRAEADDDFFYELVAGERRLRAAKMLGFFAVPCVVVEADEKTAAEMAIIENLLRKDLNMFEQACGFKNLIDIYDLTQDEVARRMSMSQSAVANKIRLLRFSEQEKAMILEHELTERHARALLRLDSEALRLQAIRHIASLSLNVANTEQYVESLLKKVTEDRASATVTSSRERAREKAVASFVENVQRKVSMFNKQGKNASVNVVNGGEYIELHIKIRN